MFALADIVADEPAAPPGRNLQERLLHAMFMMERHRGIDAGWRDLVADVADADLGSVPIGRLAAALRVFIRSHMDHPQVGAAVVALAALRVDRDADLFATVVGENSGYDSYARHQAACALEVIRP